VLSACGWGWLFLKRGGQKMTKMLALQIDGKKIFATPEATILEAARANGIEIPTLCHHPRLSALGHCRVCLVEIEGLERPVTSCDNPVAEGMIVTTTSPRLEKMRSQMIELALATHPYQDCLTCVRTGSCELQEKAYHYQVELPAQLERRIPQGVREQKYDLIRDEEKCILCGRCIEICRSGAGRFVYRMIGRGVNTRIVPWRDGREVTLEEAGCIFCGQCVDACPVAALSEKSRPSGGREWVLEAKPGICLGCSLGCYLERQVDGNRLIKNTVPQEGDRVGWLCATGKFADVDGALKASTTVRQKSAGGAPEVIDYEAAISSAAAALAKIKEENPGQPAIAVMADGSLSCEEAYLLQKFAHSVLETKAVDLGLEPAWVEAYLKAVEVTGYGVPGPTMAHLSKADAVLVIGSGLAESHPVAEMALRRAGRYSDATLIGIDRRGDSFKTWQEIILDGDGSVTLELLQDISVALKSTEPLTGPQKSGLDPNLVAKVARLLQMPKSYTLVSPTFFVEADQRLVDALIDLTTAAGQLASGEQRLLLLSASTNAAGILGFGGSAQYGPGLKPKNGEGSMNRAQITGALQNEQLKGLIYFGLSAEPGLMGSAYKVVASSADPEMPAFYDLFFPTPPAAAQEGLYITAANQIRLNQRAIVPAPGVREGWRLICDLACALGARWRYNSLDHIREEMKSLMPGG
jgi:NADH dehydrogenase/NADH:ubiquinone oxidoreductase subunit G